MELVFIGSHLAEKLISLGHKVIIIDNFSNGKINNIKSFKNKIKLIKADISKANSKWTNCFKKADYVFHLAASRYSSKYKSPKEIF